MQLIINFDETYVDIKYQILVFTEDSSITPTRNRTKRFSKTVHPQRYKIGVDECPIGTCNNWADKYTQEIWKKGLYNYWEKYDQCWDI